MIVWCDDLGEQNPIAPRTCSRGAGTLGQWWGRRHTRKRRRPSGHRGM